MEKKKTRGQEKGGKFQKKKEISLHFEEKLVTLSENEKLRIVKRKRIRFGGKEKSKSGLKENQNHIKVGYRKGKKLRGETNAVYRLRMRRLYGCKWQNVIGRKKIRNIEDPTKNYGEHDGSDLSSDKVHDAVRALLELLDKPTRTGKKMILEDDWKDIYLQITSFRVPDTHPREIRIVLPHSLFTDTAEVCLFTADLQKGKRVDHEPTLEHVKEILDKNGVTRINEVITLRQLKTEYDQYELKRALCNRFDLFLSEAKVCGHIAHYLGKIFYDRRKIPVPIKLHAKNLNECIDSALHKSSVRVHNRGTQFTLKVANTNLTTEEMHDNILAAANALRECFPGGWENILYLMIKGAKSLSIPIYMSAKSDAEVAVPIVLRPPKLARNMVDDLDAFGTVEVKPDGDVHVLKYDEEEEFEQSFSNEQRLQVRKDARNERKREYKKKRNKSSGNNTDQEENEMELDETGEASDTKVDDDDDDKSEEDSNIDSDDNDDDSDSKAKRKTGLSAWESAYLHNWEKTRTNQKLSQKS